MALPSVCLRPFAGELFFLARLQPARHQALLGAGKPAAEAQPLGVEPDLFARQVDGLQHVADVFLRRIAIGHLPDFPGVVVVHHRARRHGQIENAGHQFAADMTPDCA